ncbi:MAG: hypothetical protein KDB00_27585, partial [Planctomycetales bacterium]|nr:hypothetical protein [Planctomycetales bacterium]
MRISIDADLNKRDPQDGDASVGPALTPDQQGVQSLVESFDNSYLILDGTGQSTRRRTHQSLYVPQVPTTATTG